MIYYITIHQQAKAWVSYVLL